MTSKGDLGEIAVAKELMCQGLDVFKPVSNGTRIDLIADSGNALFKVQVKCTSSKKGRATLSLRKNTLNIRYNYKYKSSDVDVFALYIEDLDVVVFASSSLIFSEKSERTAMTFRTEPSKNNQTAKCNQIGDHLTFPF